MERKQIKLCNGFAHEVLYVLLYFAFYFNVTMSFLCRFISINEIQKIYMCE